MRISRCLDRTVHPFKLELLSDAHTDSFGHRKIINANPLSPWPIEINVSVATKSDQCQVIRI